MAPRDGGIKIYDNRFGNLDDLDANVMFVSIFATGITDCEDDGIALNCKIDGANCVPGVGTAGTGSVADIPAGWVIAQGDEFCGYGDLGDTGLSFRFCAPHPRSSKETRCQSLRKILSASLRRLYRSIGSPQGLVTP